jgi:hypothetical protein
VLFKCPDQDIKLLKNRILLYRYVPLSYQMLIPLKPKDILISDIIVEVIISRKLIKSKENIHRFLSLLLEIPFSAFFDCKPSA